MYCVYFLGASIEGPTVIGCARTDTAFTRFKVQQKGNTSPGFRIIDVAVVGEEREARFLETGLKRTFKYHRTNPGSTESFCVSYNELARETKTNSCLLGHRIFMLTEDFTNLDIDALSSFEDALMMEATQMRETFSKKGVDFSGVLCFHKKTTTLT